MKGILSSVQRLRTNSVARGEEFGRDQIVDQPLASRKKGGQGTAISILAGGWIILCVSFSVFQTLTYNSGVFPESLKQILSAAYLE